MGLHLDLLIDLLGDEVAYWFGDANQVSHALKFIAIVMRTDGLVNFLIDG